MAAPLIAALRQRDDLKESVLHTAQELAHLSSIYGIVQASYQYLAWKAHCSRRTAIRHIQQLLDAGILRKTVRRIVGKGLLCEINTYAFVIAWDKRPQQGGSDKTSRMLPPQEKEKNYGVREELANQKKMLRWGLYTPGSDQWRKTEEEITRLEGLLRGSPHERG